MVHARITTFEQNKKEGNKGYSLFFKQADKPGLFRFICVSFCQLIPHLWLMLFQVLTKKAPVSGGFNEIIEISELDEV